MLIFLIKQFFQIAVSLVQASNICQVIISSDGIVGHKSTFTRWLNPSMTTQPAQEIQIDDKRCPSIFGSIRNIELVYSPHFWSLIVPPSNFLIRIKSSSLLWIKVGYQIATILILQPSFMDMVCHGVRIFALFFST